MNKKLPKIFVNNVKKIDNNKTIFYSVKDDKEELEEKYNKIELNNKINDLFNSTDFIYKKKFHIKTDEYEGDFIIISKSTNYLLAIDGKRIYFDKIKEIN